MSDFLAIDFETVIISRKLLVKFLLTWSCTKALLFNQNRLIQEVNLPHTMNKSDLKELFKKKWYKINRRGASILLETYSGNFVGYTIYTKGNFHTMTEDGICPMCKKFSTKHSVCSSFRYITIEHEKIKEQSNPYLFQGMVEPKKKIKKAKW